MSLELTKYINSIEKREIDNFGVYPNYSEWTFFGDGEGDYEKLVHRIPDKELLLEYQKYLKHQYNLVREAILLSEVV